MSVIRSRGIGGSDIGAILGLNPWKSPIDVYMQKVGLVDSPEDNENMWWGREMEPVIRKRYENESGNSVLVYNDLPYIGPYEWFLYSPDGVIVDSKNGRTQGIWEGKTSGYRNPDYWGDAGSDQVPPEYLAQCQWYIGATKAKWADLSVLFMGRRREFIIYRIHHDQELFDNMVTRAKDFWENHIIPQIPPEPDDSKGWNEYFRKKYPQDSGYEIDANPEVSDMIQMYKWAKESLKFWEEAVSTSENKLKSIMMDATALRGPFGKITWKKNKDSIKINWEGIARQLGATQQMITNFTTVVPGVRVFRPWWAKEKK